MPRRNSPQQILELADLSRLAEIVIDKRNGQRAQAKKNRRNRHYEKQFIRNTLTHLPELRRAVARDGHLSPDGDDAETPTAAFADTPGPTVGLGGGPRT